MKKIVFRYTLLSGALSLTKYQLKLVIFKFIKFKASFDFLASGDFCWWSIFFSNSTPDLDTNCLTLKDFLDFFWKS